MNQTPTPRVVEAMDVYGKPRRVNRNDYDNGRIQLRLYTKRGTAYEFVPGIRESITIHRDNIAVIDGRTVRGFAPTNI